MVGLRPGVRMLRGGTPAAARVAAMVDLSARVSSLLALETSDEATDDEVAESVAELAEAYHGFVDTYGRVRSRQNMRAYDERNPGFLALKKLEIIDERNEFVGEGGILLGRVAHPNTPPAERASSPEEALAASLDRLGRVDLTEIASLLDIQGGDALDVLGDLVIQDPDSGEVMPAGDYLSGNLRRKLAHVDALLDEARDRPRREALGRYHASVGIAEVMETRNRFHLGEDVIEYLQATGAWLLFCDPNAAVTARPVTESAYPDARRYGARSEVGRFSVALAYLRDLADDAPFDPTAHAARASRVAVAVNPQLPLYNIQHHILACNYIRIDDPQPQGEAVIARARTSMAAICHAFASNGGRPRGYVAHVVGMSRARNRDAHDMWTSAFCRLVGMGEVYPSGMVARSSVTPQEVEDALVRNPEVAEYLLARTVDWIGMGEAERRAVAGMQGNLVASAMLPQFSTPEGLTEYRRGREAALAGAERADARTVARLERLRAQIESAMPAEIDRRDISLNLGSPWIPAKVVLDFLVEKVVDPDTAVAQLANLSVSNDPVTGDWDVHWGGCRYSDEARDRYAVVEDGVNQLSPFRIAASALCNGGLKVTRRARPGERGRGVVDEEMTLLAWDKRNTMEADFARWAWEDPVRAAMLERAYNEAINCMVPLSVDGSYLTLSDASPQIELRDHQRDAVARVVRSREGTLIAHAVGAGKTFEGIASCHEAKRLGRARKPLVAVPNGLVGQWESAWDEIYPTDRILAMTPAWTRDRESVERFWAEAAEGDWDGIVVPHTRFDEMRLGEDAVGAIGRRRYVEASLAAQEAANTPLAARRDRMAQAAFRSLGRNAREAGTGLTFENLGVDMLVVDEAHAYKNLDVASAMDVAGIPSSSSRRARALLLRCDWLRDTGHAGNIVFLTGTPVTNTMSELYVMQRLLAPQSLRSQGFTCFDQWALNFGRVSRELEVRPEGGLQYKDRFSRFTNLPELMASMRTFCDLVTNDDLDLDLPDVRVVNVEVASSASQDMCMRWLASRGELVRRNRVHPSTDNLLNITTDGRKVAIDPKLLYPDDPDVPDLGEGGKVARCAEQVADIWRRTMTDPEGNEVNGVQLVFCDSSTAASSASWNAQGALVERLVALGIPRDEVAVVSGATSVRARESAFERARSGEVRVLVGSTATLGTGVSVQQRLAAIHDLDCPWRSSDLEQRMGRIRRQGNTFADSEWWQPVCYRYATVGTFDSFLYQTAERKAHFISQVMTNENPLREAPDLTEEVLTISEMKAIVSDDPNVRRRLELENDVNALRRRRAAWSREAEQAQRDLTNEVRPSLERSRATEAALKPLAASLGSAHTAKGQTDAPWLGMRVGDVEYPATAEGLNQANEAMAAAIERSGPTSVPASDEAHGRGPVIGSYQGMDVAVTWTESVFSTLGQKRQHLELRAGEEGSYVCHEPCRSGADGSGLVRQVESMVASADMEARQAQRAVARLEARERDLERRTHERWPLERDLATKIGQLEAIPVSARSAVDRNPPTERDVHGYLAGAQAVAAQEQGAAQDAPVRHRVLLEARGMLGDQPGPRQAEHDGAVPEAPAEPIARSGESPAHASTSVAPTNPYAWRVRL